LRKKKVPAKILFYILGIVSTIWFLVRVIPKPSRATYPCMKAAAPVMASFIIYLLSLTGSVFAFRKFKSSLLKAKYMIAFSFLVAAVLAISFSVLTVPGKTGAMVLVSEDAFTANEPIGIAKGIFPGRVVWVWDYAATDETCENVEGDYWFENTDQAVVDNMLAKAVKYLTNQTTVNAAWDVLFKYFNQNHSKGETGYTAGEKICVKINLTTSSYGGFKNNTEKQSRLNQMDATPQVILALLRQLVNDVGVAQSDITVGDPYRRFHDVYWDILHPEFPDVNYMDDLGANGRVATVQSANQELVFSDGVYTSTLPQAYLDAAYFINLPCLKTHNEGGITIAAKNHQGSIMQEGNDDNTSQSAYHMHYSLPANNQGSGKYRHLVDYMGHKYLGGNTVLYLVDGIWSGKNWEGWVEKWEMSPFNGNFTSSLLLSQDAVAIESVCYDFLLKEYTYKEENYPYISGTDDYMRQAADPTLWPVTITYDPEGDGSPIGSLGVYEHWNNADDKQYTRNLGTGDGIELVKVTASSPDDPVAIDVKKINPPAILNIYPNPLKSNNLTVEINNTGNAVSEITITDIRGSQVYNLRTNNKRVEIPYSAFTAGTYLVKVKINGNTDMEKLVVE
jgi:hypothetical protein